MSIKELHTCVLARTHCAVETVEEGRVDRALLRVASTFKEPVEVIFWSAARGFTQADGSQAEITLPDPENPSGPGLDASEEVEPLSALGVVLRYDKPALFVMHDFHHYLKIDTPMNVKIVRMVRDVCSAARNMPVDRFKGLIFTAPAFDLPDDLRESLHVIRWRLPGRKELELCLKQVFSKRADIAGGTSMELREDILSAAQGLTVEEFKAALSRSITTEGALSVEVVQAAKEQAARRIGAELLSPRFNVSEVGGLEVLKEWSLRLAAHFSPEAKEFGLEPPKGMLLFGVSGCGKTYVAEAVAAAWGIKMLRLDIESLQDAYVGNSEKALNAFLDMAKAQGRVLILIDEIEKAVAGSDSGLDSGVKASMLKILLQFMQDNDTGAFVAATCNSVETIPMELTRKGRFDELFFVNLPHAVERQEILRVHIKRCGRKPEDFDLEALSLASDGFNSAEVAASVQEGLSRAFSARMALPNGDGAARDLTTEDIAAVMAETVPMSKRAAKKLAAMQAFGAANCRQASRAVSAKPEPAALGVPVEDDGRFEGLGGADVLDEDFEDFSN